MTVISWQLKSFELMHELLKPPFQWEYLWCRPCDYTKTWVICRVCHSRTDWLHKYENHKSYLYKYTITRNSGVDICWVSDATKCHSSVILIAEALFEHCCGGETSGSAEGLRRSMEVLCHSVSFRVVHCHSFAMSWNDRCLRPSPSATQIYLHQLSHQILLCPLCFLVSSSTLCPPFSVVHEFLSCQYCSLRWHNPCLESTRLNSRFASYSNQTVFVVAYYCFLLLVCLDFWLP